MAPYSQRVCSAQNWRFLSKNGLDLSPCAEDGLVAVPFVIILLGGFLEWQNLRLRDPKPATGWKTVALLRTKVTLAITITILTLARAIANVAENPGDPVGSVSAIIAFASTLLTPGLHYLAHTRSRRSSTTLLFFWLTSMLRYLLELRTFLTFLDPQDKLATFIFLVVLSSLTLIIFALECYGPDENKIKLSDSDDDSESWRESPVATANVFQRLTFSWMTPMMKFGYKKFLTEEDLWALPEKDRIDAVHQRFDKYLQRQLEKKNPRIIIALIQAFGKPFFFAAFLKMIQDILAFAQPQLLKRLLAFVEDYNYRHSEPLINGYILAFIMFACAIVQTVVLHQYFQRCFETGMRIKAAVITAIYEKSLRLSSDEKGSRAVGDIVNLQSTDAVRLSDFCSYGQIMWSGLFQLTLAFISLYDLLGVYGLIGVGIMVLSLPLNALLARLQSRLQRKQMKVKDKRTRLMSEILNNIRSIKLYAWEEPFAKRLFAIRNDKELVMLRKMGYFSAATNFIWTFTPFLVSFATFAVYGATSGKPLTSQIIFPAISLFQLLSFPLAAIPMVLTSGIEAYVALVRLKSFFTAKELQDDAVIRKKLINKPEIGDEFVRIEKADFAWSSSNATVPILQDIDISVAKGELLSVIGSVGCGKSSLLSAIVGEMIKLEGSVTTYGSIAYVPQQSWIMGGTVKENIVFGHRFDPEFYEKTLDACALREDLAMLPEGDGSEVGEKGLTLSGGQKARITLARAVYARADIYLLDDPLSAVDSHVARHLFDKVLGPNGLLSSKARILCTNALAFVKCSDSIIYIRKGIIAERGTYDDIIKGDGELCRMLAEHGTSSSTPDDGNSSVENGSDETVVVEETIIEECERYAVDPHSPEGKMDRRRLSHAVRRASMVSLERQKQEALVSLKASGRSKEHMERGSVKTDVYKSYIKANGIAGITFYILLILCQQAFSVAGNFWLKNWSQNNTDEGGNSNLKYYLAVYFSLGFLQALCSLGNVAVLFALCIVRAAKTMHDGMYNAVMRSPMQFFETTPIGVVLNRFSRDIYVIDERLAMTFGSFFRVVASVLGVVFVIGTSAPMFLAVAIPLFFLYRSFQSYYLKTSRELKRVDSVTRSPIFASFSETLVGLSTIRAFGQTRRFSALNEARIQRNQEAFFLSISANRWLAIRLEFIGSIVILTTAGLAVYTMANNGLNAGLAGLMLSYALSLTQSLNWTVRMATEIETNIVSVERVSEYMKLKPEAPFEIESTSPDPSWPAEGAIDFKEFSMRYRENLSPVLKRITFSVLPQEKIGICGRTGAGKSSLMMALFRVVEGFEGQILIDGVDISKIGLKDLRSKLSIIPQDSQCFEGTIRDNIDPVGTHTDTEVWLALEQARMKDHVQSMHGGLDAHVEESGNNLSAGQRQLICLARALLRKSKVLVLDEATSSADAETDRRVQEVIRSEFKDCTILTIAHRLNTIVDSSRVLSMNQGNVAEYDTPKTLFEKDGSLFQALCQQAGIEHID